MAATAVVALCAAGAAQAADEPGFEIYGFAQLDAIQDFNRVHPDWDATLRPSKIPTEKGLYGDNGQSIFSVRQSRFGIKGNQTLGGREATFKFEFDLYGVGDDAGQTTMRLRHFYASWGPILAGQTNSVFMDGDIFPNTIDYWGPNGMVFLRTPQLRYTFGGPKNEIAIALESATNDVDGGNVHLLDPELGANLQGSEKMPDITAHWRYTGGWGHMQLAGILRKVAFETAGTPGNEPSGDDLGWGINATSNIKVGKKDVAHLGVVYGNGIASYMNDGGVDLAPKAGVAVSPPIVGAPPGPIVPKAVPLLGVLLYYDHYWSDQWSSSIGWSQVKVDNTNFQAGDAFRNAQYASANLLWTPDPKLLFGVEYLWGERKDNDRAKGEDNRIQFTAKYSFTSKDFFQ